MYSMQRIISILITVLCLMIAAIIHEVAHGAVAYACGDPTAKEAGRLTLNPLAHIDPTGSIVLPCVMALLGGPVFAYARPVPYNPKRLRHPVRDEVLVALAGPASNLLQAALAAAILRFGFLDNPSALTWVASNEAILVVLDVLSTYMWVNISLMLFNLIPLPPLDGSAIISPLLHNKAREMYYRIQAYAMPILIAALYILPYLLGWNPIGAYISHVGGALFDVLLGL